MVEARYGLEVADRILEESELPSGGSYTAVGTYSFNEMLELITHLSAASGVPTSDLLYIFGKHLYFGLSKAHPQVVKSYRNPLDLIASIEDHIHMQVIKLYPDAALPTFSIVDKSPNRLVVIYHSERALYRLAEGLMESAYVDFGRKCTIVYELLEPGGTRVKFTITED